MEGDFSLNRYIYEGLSSLPPSLFPNYISAFQTEINGGEGCSSSLQLYGGGGVSNNNGGYSVFGSHPVMSNPIGCCNETDLMGFQRNRVQQSSFINGDCYNNQNLMRSLIVSGSGLDDNVVNMEQQQQLQLIPKSEIFDDPTPLNMIIGEGYSIPDLNYSSGGVYHHQQLPVLCSLEPNIYDAFPVSEPAPKRFRSSSSTDHDSLMPTQTTIPFFSLSSLLRSTPSSVAPSAIVARQRSKMISDRIRSLAKLMPWNNKMNMATLLEEVYKYIKFLQAQVSVLQAMPIQSSFMSSSSSSASEQQKKQVAGGLEKLNRQQLLKVLMNSPVAQTILYRRNCCVYSLEQLILLKKIAAHKILLQQMMMEQRSTSSSSSVYSRESLP